MVNFLRMELKKVLGMTRYSEDATYIGSCGYVRVNEEVRMRLEFSRSSTTTYDGIVMTMFNRKEGTIDTNALKFRDIWGRKAVSNPNFKEGIIPHIWKTRGRNGMSISRIRRITRYWRMRLVNMLDCFRRQK